MRRALPSAGAVVVAAILAAAAYGANVVANPGFETDCAGTPCNWGSPFGGTATRDTTFTPHSGAASLDVAASAAATGASVLSDCFPLAAGQHAASFWFNFEDARVPAATFDLLPYSTTDCTGIQVNPQPQLNGTQGDGAWHQVAGVITAPPGTQSARVALLVNCQSSVCGGGETVHFDDIAVDSTVTAVAVRGLTATRVPGGVRLAWRAAGRGDLVGFDVYRGSARLNRRLIAAGKTGRYTFVDRRAPRAAVRYRLRLVYADGTRAWSSSVAAR